MGVYTHEPLDLCFTNVTELTYKPFVFDTVKWSKLVGSNGLAPYKELADCVFKVVGQQGCVCPKVTKDDGVLTIEWSNDHRILRIKITHEGVISFARGHQTEDLDEVEVDEREEFFKILPALANFVTPAKVYKNDDCE